MKKYYLFNSITRLMSGPFDTSAAVDFLVKQDSLSPYHFWYEGKEGWSTIESNYDFIALIQKAKGAAIPPPPPPPPSLDGSMPAPSIKNPSTIETPKEASIVLESKNNDEEKILLVKEDPAQPTQSAENKSNQRSHPRIQCNMRTIITNKKKTFITNTTDISLGGIKVSHQIPEEIFQGECEVYITGPQQFGSILLKCKPVTDARHTERFSFTNLDEKNQTKLKTWFDNLVNQVKN